LKILSHFRRFCLRRPSLFLREQEKTWSPQAETPHGRKYQQDWDILLTKLLKPPACNPAAKAAAKTAAKTAAEAAAEAAAKVMPKEKDL